MNLANVLVPYLLGILTPLVVDFFTRGFGLRHQELGARVDELCALISDQAERAARYWALAPESSDVAEAAAKIVAVDAYIGALLQHIVDEFPRFRPHLEDDPLFRFADAVGGDNFQVVGRPAEPTRAAVIYGSAFELCLALRRGRRDSFFPPRLPW
jgi:hypothetical protein